MPTAFARLDARGTGVCGAAYVAFRGRRCTGRDAVLTPEPRLTPEKKAARRDTRRRFSCFVAWPSAS